MMKDNSEKQDMKGKEFFKRVVDTGDKDPMMGLVLSYGITLIETLDNRMLSVTERNETMLLLQTLLMRLLVHITKKQLGEVLIDWNVDNHDRANITHDSETWLDKYRGMLEAHKRQLAINLVGLHEVTQGDSK